MRAPARSGWMINRGAAPPPLPLRGLVVLLVLLLSSMTLFQQHSHAGPADAELAVALAMTAGVSIEDCDRHHGYDSADEHCSVVSVCKTCLPFLESVEPRDGASIRHFRCSHGSVGLSTVPLRKPPKSIVLA